MRITQKLELIDKIGRELQSRFGFDEINSFLAEFDVPPPQGVTANSKWVYSKVALSGAPNSVILDIARELDIGSTGAGLIVTTPPRNWKNINAFRLFISHLSKDKLKATRLKDCLASYSISGFVAHEDIHPTLEWQGEIEKALRTMDAFLAVHTPGFSQSIWTQQEVGFAIGRGAKIISLKMGEDPTGFISKHQALARRDRTAEQIAKEVNSLLQQDPMTSTKLREAKLAASPDEVPF